ncbi:MAG: type II toxin-antitoxin system antitoxin [Planctomycetota bacterium]
MGKSERKSFLLRLDARVHRALQRWSDDEMRSLNAHIQYLLREALARAGRLREGEKGRKPAKKR